MPEVPQRPNDESSELETWLASLASLGKRLTAPPSSVEEKAPAGEPR
jgi:hypothetical protein